MTHTEKLDAKIKLLQRDEGVIDIKLFPCNPMLSQEAVAKGVLDLMNAPIVKDPDFF